MKRTMTDSAINRLGRRLVNAATPSDEDLTLLAAFQSEYEALIPVIRGRMTEAFGSPPIHDGVSLEISDRIKTPNTLLDKVRGGSRLSKIEDVAGVRITGGFFRTQQDEICARLALTFDKSRMIDRRADPRSGYRAVHVVAWLGDFTFEIQVRTFLQDLWAHAMEAQADAFGRAIRYQGPPEAKTEAELAQRVDAINASIELADLLAATEEEYQEFLVRARERRLDAFRDGHSDRERQEVDQQLRRLQARVAARIEEILARCSPEFVRGYQRGLEGWDMGER